MILRKEDGTTQSWLDKSKESGGYEGEPAAVNWKNISEKYYYETKVNAADFIDIKVTSKMLYNYNAYSVQKLEGSRPHHPDRCKSVDTVGSYVTRRM